MIDQNAATQPSPFALMISPRSAADCTHRDADTSKVRFSFHHDILQSLQLTDSVQSLEPITDQGLPSFDANNDVECEDGNQTSQVVDVSVM